MVVVESRFIARNKPRSGYRKGWFGLIYIAKKLVVARNFVATKLQNNIRLSKEESSAYRIIKAYRSSVLP